MDTFLQALRSLGPLRLSVIGVVIIGLIGFFIYLVTRLSTPQMALLYSNMEPSDTTRIAQQLDASNTPYEIRVNGTQVYVPADRVETLRLTTAEQGLTGGALPGYEIFDDADALGSTNFIQNVNLVRALEGELARTIRSIESVKSARVHLVMPKRELFSREKQQPTASVILKMKGANRLDKNQIAAVQQLIATAVPGLSPNHISVVDDRGTLLARGFEEEGAAGSASTKIEEKRRAFELRTVKTIEELLEKTVGFGRVRAEVTAEMDFDRIVTNEVSFDPDGQVVRSTQSIEETASSREAEGTPPVSVATNLPDAQSAGGENAGSTAAESRTEETVNFEITKKETNHVREAGVVKRLSVAVLIDGNYTTNEGGERTYQPRAEAEMELLATLVRGAIGFNADRGLANVDIQLGLMPKHDLGSVITGRLTLNQATMVYEDGGFDVIAGRSGSGRLANIPASRLQILGDDLTLLSAAYDRVVLDLGAGVERTVRQLANNVGSCVVVTSDEPTSLTDAYAFIKVTQMERPGTDIRIVVNMANSTREGERTYNTLHKACEGFLKISPPLLGIIRRDNKVREAIRSQTSLLTRYPNTEAATDVESIADKLLSQE